MAHLWTDTYTQWGIAFYIGTAQKPMIGSRCQERDVAEAILRDKRKEHPGKRLSLVEITVTTMFTEVTDEVLPCGCDPDEILHDPQVCSDWDEFRPKEGK